MVTHTLANSIETIDEFSTSDHPLLEQSIFPRQRERTTLDNLLPFN